jgi:tetratricopeptide (TPR) repeat protein
MKAEHRHELKTNALADMMGRALHTIKTGPSRHGLLIVVIIAVVAAVALGGYVWWKDRRDARSELWLKVDDAERKLDLAANGDEVESALKGFEQIAQKNAGTLPARVMRFDRARTLFRQGMERLYSPDREKAVKDLKEARDLYTKLAADPAGRDNEPILIQEAMMSVAQADESLGDLEPALKGYSKLASAYPNSVLGKAAKERADYLGDENNRKRVQDLYDKLAKEVDKSLPLPSEGGDKK